MREKSPGHRIYNIIIIKTSRMKTDALLYLQHHNRCKDNLKMTCTSPDRRTDRQTERRKNEDKL